VSPLRYPGGKGKLAPYLKAIIRQNKLLDCTYVEPFAGGAGAGLALLLHGYVNRIVLNDLSAPIFAFWRALLDFPEDFQERIRTVELSVDEWKRQKDVFRSSEFKCEYSFELGFATFYLNRTNRSGVLNGGMIGGYAQKSDYGVDARFNRDELIERVRRISKYRSKISVINIDAADLLANMEFYSGDKRPFLYIDPPYFKKARDLYYDFYKESDHEILRDRVVMLSNVIPWVVSYDNEPDIMNLYSSFDSLKYDLSYSVKNGRVGKEVMFFSRNLNAPPLSAGKLRKLSAVAQSDSC
jgi:DNA adenine methylase